MKVFVVFGAILIGAYAVNVYDVLDQEWEEYKVKTFSGYICSLITAQRYHILAQL